MVEIVGDAQGAMLAVHRFGDLSRGTHGCIDVGRLRSPVTRVGETDLSRFSCAETSAFLLAQPGAIGLLTSRAPFGAPTIRFAIWMAKQSPEGIEVHSQQIKEFS